MGVKNRGQGRFGSSANRGMNRGRNRNEEGKNRKEEEQRWKEFGIKKDVRNLSRSWVE